MTVLSVEALEVRYGLLRAIRGVTFGIEEAETIALIGANGAGKTTLLRAIAGSHFPASGRVRLDDRDVTATSAHRRVRSGIALVPEGRKLFPGLTVEENLLVAKASRREGRWTLDSVVDAFPILGPLLHREAASLSGGEQHAAAIGRALMCNPRLLLVDEVSLGLAPVAVDNAYAALRSLVAERVTIVFVEQDLARAFGVATRVLCLREGELVVDATPESLSRDEIAAAYFGLRRTDGPVG